MSHTAFFPSPPDILRPIADDISCDNEKVTTKYLNGLIELIHSNLAGNQQDSASVEASRKHFLQTLEMIRSKEYEGIVLTPK